MNHMLAPLERLVMAGRKGRNETGNNGGVGLKQLSFPLLVCHCKSRL